MAGCKLVPSGQCEVLLSTYVIENFKWMLAQSQEQVEIAVSINFTHWQATNAASSYDGYFFHGILGKKNVLVGLLNCYGLEGWNFDCSVLCFIYSLT